MTASVLKQDPNTKRFKRKNKKVSFIGLIKGISPKICILCVRVKINKRSFEQCSSIPVNNEHSSIPHAFLSQPKSTCPTD